MNWKNFAHTLPSSTPLTPPADYASMFDLRDYQLALLEGAASAIDSGKNAPLVVAPTGSGKGLLIAELVRRHCNPGRILVLAHRNELIRQLYASATARVEASLVGAWAAQLPRLINRAAPVQVASVGTILSRGLPGFDPTLVIIDEAHRYAKGEFKGLLDRYPNARRVGFTATPQRSDGTPLGDAFDALICAITPSELMDMGFLVPCRVIAPDKRLGSAARDTGEDEEAGSVDLAMPPLEAYLAHAKGLKTIVFAHTIEAAMQYERDFRGAGIRARAVHAKMGARIRDAFLRAFRVGDMDVLINVMVFTEGLDIPDTQACILARACRSELTFLQIVGRILRPAPGKTEALLIDLTGAVHEHGTPDEDRTFDLDGKGISRKAICQCDACGVPFVLKDVTYGHMPGSCARCATLPRSAYRHCPKCGHHMSKLQKARKDQVVGDLSLSEVKAPKPRLRDWAAARRDFDGWIQKAAQRKYKPGWVGKTFQEKYGRWPPWPIRLPGPMPTA